MRSGAKTEAGRRPPDPNLGRVPSYEITRFRYQLFESTDRTGSFLDERIAAGAKQLRLESAIHIDPPAKSGSGKCKHDCARSKTLRWKLHDVSWVEWERRRARCGSIREKTGRLECARPIGSNRWRVVLENLGRTIADDFMERIFVRNATLGAGELHQKLGGKIK